VLIISKNLDKKSETLVNENITFKEVLVIDEDGNQLGTMTPSEGVKLAEQKNFDLVCVAPNAKIPVCRFMNYSKYRYELQKKAREAKKNQKVLSMKEIWLSPVISSNDLETKLKSGRKFLLEGCKLKVTLRFTKRRMIGMMNQNDTVLDRVAEKLSDISTVEQAPVLEGRNMTLILMPKKDNK
jgi:translation initiation factor IF-3